MAVLVAAPEHQAVREAVLCTQLQDATGLQNPAYLGQHPTLTIFRRQLGDLLGAPLKNEIEDDDIIGIVRRADHRRSAICDHASRTLFPDRAAYKAPP